MYLLEVGENPESGLRRIMLEKIDESIDQLSMAGADPDVVVHEVRKSVKRIRAVLRLARPAMEDADYRRENLHFRDMGRRLAEARDAAVLPETLARILRASDRLEGEIDRISRDLIGPYAGHALPGDPGLILVKDLIAGFRSAAARAAAINFAAPDCDFLYQGLVETAGEACSGFEAALQAPDSFETFHEWRKQVKYLWHQFEIVSTIAASINAVLIEDLEHLSEQLGLAHDTANLHMRLEGMDSSRLNGEIGLLTRQVGRVRRDHEGAALAHGTALFSRGRDALLKWFPTGD